MPYRVGTPGKFLQNDHTELSIRSSPIDLFPSVASQPLKYCLSRRLVEHGLLFGVHQLCTELKLFLKSLIGETFILQLDAV